eukprot:779244-Alexandrium_andersonii.AAC.1
MSPLVPMKRTAAITLNGSPISLTPSAPRPALSLLEIGMLLRLSAIRLLLRTLLVFEWRRRENGP